MMRSLYSGVSGLRTHQTKMDVIGNNIANVNTTSYKKQSITFSDLMYQTTQSASGPNGLTGRGGVNPRQIGLGVQSAAINTAITTPGSTQATGNPFDLKINGEAFFIVSNGTQNFFTRDGSFYVDGAGNLAMTSNGYTVMGWGVDDDGAIKPDTVAALQIMSEANMTYPPEATTEAYISGVCDKNDTNINSSTGKIMNLSFYDKQGYAYTAKLSVHATTDGGTFYVQLDDILDSNGKSVVDSFDGANSIADIATLGGNITVNVNDTKGYGESIPTYVQRTLTSEGLTGTALDGTETLPTLTSGTVAQKVVGADGVTIKYFVDGSGNLFDTDGNPVYSTTVDTLTNAGNTITVSTYATEQAVSAAAIAALEPIYGTGCLNGAQTFKIDAATGKLVITSKNVTGAKLQYNKDTGAFESIGGGKSITLDFAGSVGSDTLGMFEDINIDFSGTHQSNKNGTATLGANAGTLASNGSIGSGRKEGEMSGISIENNGLIYLHYDNNMSKVVGQIAVAIFANASGLQKEGDNLYSATSNSGAFDGIGKDITSDGSGSMQTGALEMSNVDLSQEFTEMITTQRGFQANSRIITVSDTLLEELTNLKR